MFQPLFIAATGLDTFENEISDVTNNLSNARTVGFKKGRTEKESLFYVDKSFPQYLTEATNRQSEIPIGSLNFGGGVRVGSTTQDFSQGSIEITNNPFDFAIQGEGFFQVRTPDGSLAYARAGNFHVDNEGNLVDPNGNIAEPAVTIPEGTAAIQVRTDGVIFAQNAQGEQQEIGSFTLARFTNPSALKPVGRNLYQVTPASGEATVGTPTQDGFGSINQFSLEQSNVDVVSELTRMVLVQRVFETVSRAIQAYDGMLASLNQIRA